MIKIKSQQNVKQLLKTYCHSNPYFVPFFLQIISDQTDLSEFYKVITLSKEAFQKSRNSNNTVTFDAFAVIIKFQNMSKVREESRHIDA